VILGAARFEQFGHTRQTAGDVLGPRAFAGDTGNHVACLDVLTVFDRQNRIDRHLVGNRIACRIADRITGHRIHDDNLGLQIVALGGRPPIRHDTLCHTGCLVGVFAHRNARNQIDKARGTGLFGDDRQSVGVPFKQFGTAFHRRPILDVNLGTVRQFMRRTFLTRIINDRDLHVPTHHDEIAAGVFQQVGVAELDLAFL